MLRENSTQASLEDMLKADLANRGRMNMYRIIIKGVRAPELMLLPEKLKTYGYVTEVLDESSPVWKRSAKKKASHLMYLMITAMQMPALWNRSSPISRQITLT